MKSLELFIFIFGICIAYFSYANNINEGEHTRYIEVREITNLCGVNCVYIVQKIYNISLIVKGSGMREKEVEKKGGKEDESPTMPLMLFNYAI